MVDAHEQSSEFHRSRQPNSVTGGHADNDTVSPYSQGVAQPTLHAMMRSASLGASHNAPVRAQAMHQMQRTHGNRAVQRQFAARAPSGQVSVQRSPTDDDSDWLGREPDGDDRRRNAAPNHLPSPTIEPGRQSAIQSGNAPGPEFVPKPVPARGEIGHVAPYKTPKRDAQPLAGHLTDENGQPVLNEKGNRIRTTENEHIMPRGNMEAMTKNPGTGQPDYRQYHYDRDATVRFDRETALKKTNGGPTTDNVRTKSLKAKVSNGESINYRPDVFEASIDNAKRARDATGNMCLTDEAIHRGALGQDANLFAMQEPGESGAIVRELGSHIDDFDIVEHTGSPHVPDAPVSAESGGFWRSTFRPGGAVDRTMRGANYGFQFLGNLAQGQDLGEATVGALGGGLASNTMSKFLSANSPKGGAIDAAINLGNAGLQALGAPEEVTTVTQTAADATPSSFATSLASNAGRGLWNAGKGLVTGDWDPLKKQGEDLTHGKSGAPLQGYALIRELFNSRERYGEISDEMREGKWGSVPKTSLKIKDYVTDKAGNDIRGVVGDDNVAKFGDFMGMGTSKALDVIKQEQGAEQRRNLLYSNQAQLKEQYGEAEFLRMWRGEVPITQAVQEMEEDRVNSEKQTRHAQMEKLQGKEKAEEYAASMHKLGIPY